MYKIAYQYKGVYDVFSRYWSAYGGWEAIIKSPYFHLSIILTAISYGTWTGCNWFELPISVLPSIIGFSLGGYAIWLALGDEKFKAAISGKTSNGKESPFIIVNATFVHFISLQILALVFALTAKSFPIFNISISWQQAFVDFGPWLCELLIAIKYIGSMLGYLLFIYAILSALAATMAIFRIAGWLEIHHQKK